MSVLIPKSSAIPLHASVGSMSLIFLSSVKSNSISHNVAILEVLCAINLEIYFDKANGMFIILIFVTKVFSMYYIDC